MGRGPGIRILGKEAIQFDFRWKGERYRPRLRLSPTPANLKFCKRLKAVITHEIAIGTFNLEKHFPDYALRTARHEADNQTRLARALHDYLSGLSKQIEPETAKKYALDAQALVRGLGNVALGEITRAKVRDYVGALNLSKKRIDNLLTPLRGALAQAVEDGTLKENPLAGFKVRRVKKSGETIDPFTRQEIEALGKTVLGTLWTVWAWTGVRSGELIGLRWGDVDLQCSAITIRRSVRVGREKTTKTKQGNRVVRLLQPAREALLRLTRGEPEEPVFTNPSTNKRWHEDRALARAFLKACEAEKVRYRYPYQLRHTFASWALSSGENPLWVAKQMGHADVSMIFRVYGKYMPDMNPEAGKKMAG